MSNLRLGRGKSNYNSNSSMQIAAKSSRYSLTTSESPANKQELQMLQNRVDPWGNLCAVPDRGTLMGNRGILHDNSNNIVRPWAHKSWVICLTKFNNIERPKPFSKGNYSELFFLDEATGLAAGHRPCWYCQRERNKLFKDAWIKANVPSERRGSVTMAEIDKVIHSERALPSRGKKTFAAALTDLPVGTMFDHDDRAYLVHHHLSFLPWSFAGYGAPVALDSKLSINVLTPASVVRAFQNGFEPETL